MSQTHPPANPASEEEAGDSKLQAAAKVIAHDEWTRLSPGAIRYDALSPITRAILESVAMKGLCVGLLTGNTPLTPTCNESLQVADAEHLQGDTM